MRQHYRKIEQAVKRARRVLLASHEYPDGDGLGAMLAFAHYLDEHDIPYTNFSTHEIGKNFQFMPGTANFVIGEQNLTMSDHDVLVLFDIGDIKRSRFAGRLKQQKDRMTVINIDHHPTITEYEGTDLVDINVVDTESSATALMVHEFFALVGFRVSQGCATCLMTGIVFDTGSFTNLGTTPPSMKAAAELLRSGARFNRITVQTMKTKSLPKLRLWGRAFERLKEDSKSGMVTTALFRSDIRECGADDDDAEGLSNFLNELEGERVVCVFRETEDGKVKASLRTTAPEGDVRALAERYGGGGHKKAAGYTLKGKIIEKPEQWGVEVER